MGEHVPLLFAVEGALSFVPHLHFLGYSLFAVWNYVGN